MRKYVLFTCAVLVVLGLLFWHSRLVHEDAEAPAVSQGLDTVPMLITQVQQCARLYTAEYRVHKIVTHDDVLRLKGSVMQRDFNIKVPLGERKIAIPIDAKLKAYIDFSHFSEQNIERRGDKITILLPDPKVTMMFRMRFKLPSSYDFTYFSDKELAGYQQQGREAIIASIPELGILETAQENAAKVLVPMLKDMGYREENITIAFRKRYGAEDIRQLLKLED